MEDDFKNKINRDLWVSIYNFEHFQVRRMFSKSLFLSLSIHIYTFPNKPNPWEHRKLKNCQLASPHATFLFHKDYKTRVCKDHVCRDMGPRQIFHQPRLFPIPSPKRPKFFNATRLIQSDFLTCLLPTEDNIVKGPFLNFALDSYPNRAHPRYAFNVDAIRLKVLRIFKAGPVIRITTLPAESIRRVWILKRRPLGISSPMMVIYAAKS